MESFRERYAPEELLGILARLSGLRDTAEPVSAQELIADFSWDRIPKAPIPVPNELI